MSSSAPGDHRTMIGLPTTYRAGQPRAQPPPEDEYNAYLAQMRASGLPSSTMPSAAHSGTGRSLDQHPNASTLDNGNPHFGVFEPQGPPRSYSSFAPLLDPAQQQQVQGDFVPGGGGGVYRPRMGARPHPHVQTQSTGDVSRSSTTMSGYSDPSSSANRSPVRQVAPNAAFAQPFASPPDYSNPAAFTFPGPANHALEYASSGSDPFPPSDQYTSPSPGRYMSSPEQIQAGHVPQQQPRPMGNMFGTTSPPFTSPTRPGPAPYVGNASGEAWLPTTGLAPASIVPISGNASSGSSGGGGGNAGARGGAFSGSSGGSNPNVPRPAVGTAGRSRSTGGAAGGNASRYQHTHSQSAGLLAPPQAHKRQRRMPEEEDDSESDEEGAGHGHGGGQAQAAKRL
ncbi:hypothetical protein FRC10_001713 [Ceratobasidium sp. 414]|nr:hypothetical protein FRC10_001713 [Ceratobasidium sp. 414]